MLCIDLVYTKPYMLYIQQNKYYNQKSENFENITFLLIIYKSVTKNPKTFRKSEKNVSGGRKAIPIRFIKVNLINIETLEFD